MQGESGCVKKDATLLGAAGLAALRQGYWVGPHASLTARERRLLADYAAYRRGCDYGAYRRGCVGEALSFPEWRETHG